MTVHTRTHATALILVGGGEHARVVADAVASHGAGYELLGFVDPQECPATIERGLNRLGSDDVLAQYAGADAILALGALDEWPARRRIAERLAAVVGGWATVVHAHAWVSPHARLGPGTVVMAGAVVQGGARIGAHCVINTGAVVEHDVAIGDNVHLAPRAVVGGGARIGADSYIGMGAVIRDHIEVGAAATVGMGAVVVRDVAPGQTVLGVPARPQNQESE